jgi:type IV secretion system protein VirD4
MDDHLQADLPRGVRAGEGTGPSALFSSAETVLSDVFLRFEQGKHFLGVVNALVHEETHAYSRTDRYCTGGHPVGIATDSHACTISPQGRARSCILPNLFLYPGSFVTIDIGGDLAVSTAAFRAAKGQQCIVIDPFGVASGVAAEMRGSFNPLEVLNDPLSDTRVEDASMLASAIVEEEEGKSDPHWNRSARQFLASLILHVATAPDYEGKRNLGTVYSKLAQVGVGPTVVSPAAISQLQALFLVPVLESSPFCNSQKCVHAMCVFGSTRSLSIMATARLVNDHCEPSFSARSITSLATARPRASPVSMSLRK